MQTQFNEITTGTRKFLRPKLRKHPVIHNFTISIHRLYCSLTGGLHVLPDFLIIGAQKSGTNSLYWYLLQHPLVQPAVTKEIRFFDKYYQRGMNWYRVCYPLKIHKSLTKLTKKKAFLTGEATERYLEYPWAPQRVKKLIPNSKFIVLLRNPIDRAYSHYNMRFNSKRESLSFEEAIKMERERTKEEFEKMLKDPNYYSREYFHHSYLDRGIYVDKLKRWMEIFPREQFLIIQSEVFSKNPSTVYKKILKFLNLPEHDLKKYQPVGKADYKSGKMKSETRKLLSNFFKPHNDRLFEFLGEKYDWDN